MTGGADTHEPEYEELIAGYALHALEPADEARLVAHLVGCASCRALVVEMRHVAAELAYDAPDVEPPPEVLTGIRTALAAEVVVVPAPGGESGGDEGERAGVPVASDQVASSRRRRMVSVRLVVAGAAAAVVGLAALGAYAAHEADRGDAARSALSAQQAALAHLDAPGAYTVRLTSGGAATGTAVVDGRDVWLIARDLATNDRADSIYVLWAQPSSKGMVGLSAFDVRSGGLTVVHATLPAASGSPRVFGVTHEGGRAIPAAPGTAVLGAGAA